MKIIKKIALVIFKDKKVLMVREYKEKEVFYSLGGKIKPGETDLDCLEREVGEEISCRIDPKTVNFLTEFEYKAHGKEDALLNIRIYTGRLIGEPKPSSEIVEIGYFDTKSDKKHLTEMAQRKIFPWLLKHQLIG